MPDPRLPLTIKLLPGGFSVQFADGSRPIMIYGRDPHVASAANSLTLDEARELAQEVARALTGGVVRLEQPPRHASERAQGQQSDAHGEPSANVRRRAAVVGGFFVTGSQGNFS